MPVASLQTSLILVRLGGFGFKDFAVLTHFHPVSSDWTGIAMSFFRYVGMSDTFTEHNETETFTPCSQYRGVHWAIHWT